MDIDFKNKKLEKCCNTYKDGVKKWGEKHAKKVFQRLAELRAAHDLSEISYLPPPRCHAVEGIRNDCWAVDTMHPYQLVFKINQEPIPKLPDGGIDKTKVVSIII